MSQQFQNLGLSEQLSVVLDKLGFSSPTEIQSKAIAPVLNGDDVLAGAQTGTGKTAAFGLPIIQKFVDSPIEREPNSTSARALVLVPTRELAQQVFDNLTQYAGGIDLKNSHRVWRNQYVCTNQKLKGWF